MFLVRCAALAALASGCGDEGDDNGPIGGDGGVDGGMDGGSDGGVDGGGDAGSDASLEAGTELEAALRIEGVRVDRRRAELVLPPYCALYVQVAVDAGTPAQCTAESLAQFDLAKSAGDTEACIDASLDLSSCIVTSGLTLAETRCEPLIGVRDGICAGDGGL